MVKIIFALQFQSVIFHCDNIEKAQDVIRNFEVELTNLKENEDKAFWAHNEDGHKVAMVKLRQVVGVYLLKPEESWKS